jgi:hypothetical protein
MSLQRFLFWSFLKFESPVHERHIKTHRDESVMNNQFSRRPAFRYIAEKKPLLEATDTVPRTCENFRAYFANTSRQRKMRELIATIRIQKTWRSFLVDRDARVERAEAILNQIMNPIETRENRDMPDDISYSRKSVSIGEASEVKTDDNVIFAEVIAEDEMKEAHWSFNQTINMWFEFLETHGSEMKFNGFTRETFFDEIRKKSWFTCSSSSHWPELFEDLLKLLEDGPVVLWGHAMNQRFRKVFPLDRGGIEDLMKLWKLHLAEKKLEKLTFIREGSAERRRQLAEKKLEKLSFVLEDEGTLLPLINGTWLPNGSEELFTMNHSAEVFIPGSSWGKKEDDLEERFMKLLAYSQPTCNVSPL